MANKQRSPDTAAQLRREMGFLSDAELAAILEISPSTVITRRHRKQLPPSSKIGLRHLTKLSDALAWLEQRKNERNG